MKKLIKNTILTLVILALCASTIYFAYLLFSPAEEEPLSGEWTAELDMTGQAAAVAFGWLRDIEGVSLSLEDMELYMQELTVQVNLTLEQTARSEGAFRCYVVSESYDACSQAAYEAFAAVFRELLAERLRMAGYTGSTDREAVEALAAETFGMPTVSYLMSCAPALLPPLEDLQVQYDGRGVYEAAEGILTRYPDTGGAAAVRVERYIRQGGTLILSEDSGSAAQGFLSDHYPLVYTLKQVQ